MALQEEFETTGNWLFRRRSYLPLIMIGIFLLALVELEHPSVSHELNEPWELFCLIVSFLGLGIRVITIGHTPKGTSGRNTKEQVADTLNTTGVYSIVRNPLYVGNFFMGLGLASLAQVWWLDLIYVLVFLVYYERIVFAEEAYLRTRFGDEYLGWAKVTPAAFPKLSNYRKASLSFSIRNALKREYHGFFMVTVVFFVLKVSINLIVKKTLDVDPMSATILGVGFIVWMTVRILAKTTTLLNVDGR